MRFSRRLAVSVGVGLLFACAEEGRITSPSDSEYPSFTIADAARDFQEGFYWLPPLVKQPTYGGAFDAGVAPTVQVCELMSAECSAIIATFTTQSGPGSETVRVDVANQHYLVNWHTDQFDLSTASMYRISVFAGANRLLGFADVQPVGTGKDLKNVDTDEAIALLNGRTLVIKFRIETGIVGGIQISPEHATVSIGQTVQYAASLTDLHGTPLVGPTVSWSSADAEIATVDAGGLATGVEPGSVTISATSQGMSATATLEVVGGFASISGGILHSCALTHQGDAFCWGRNAEGQLGDGTNHISTVPVAVAGGLSFTSISAGGQHSCAVTADGDGYCWGANGWGELGNGHPGSATNAPVPVAGGLSFASIETSGTYTCGLATDGVAYCWGNGWGGVPAPVPGGQTFASISVGGGHLCGITPGGLAYCMGNNGFGQLGDGTYVTRTSPVAVFGGHSFTSIEAGSEHTCAITAGGAAYCWGKNWQGQLGQGAFFAANNVPAAVLGGLSFGSISASEEHSCGVTTSGDGYCWGGNGFGQLGVGTLAYHTVPVAVQGLQGFVTISTGFFHSCGVLGNGDAYCWGHNGVTGNGGQLGEGSYAGSLVPVAVVEP